MVMIGDVDFEFAEYKKLPENMRPEGTSSEACPAIQMGMLNLGNDPLRVYVFTKTVKEEVPSDDPYIESKSKIVDREFRAYRCQYPKRDVQSLCRGCPIRTGKGVFLRKIQV